MHFFLKTFQNSSNRLFWKGFLLTVSCLFALLCYDVVEKFLSDQTLIRMSKRQYKVNEIPFPAITFCPDLLVMGHNISPALELHEMLGNRVILEKFLDNMRMHSFKSFYEDFNLTAETLLPELRRRTQLEWFTQCVIMEWKDQYSVMVDLILTRHGFCFSFNMRPIESLLRFDK